MKQVYIIHENHPKLLLFFAGWAADETLFKQYCPKGMDYMICYDYRTLDFDTSLLNNYRQVNVVAWSMGVWAATIALSSVPHDELFSIAFNGSTFPIDDSEGIPLKTFQATLDGLTPASLQKFMRRMCKDSNAYKEFLKISPRRDFDEIKEELILIKEQLIKLKGMVVDEDNNYDIPDEESDRYDDDYEYEYDFSFIGKRDRIFPPENLKLSFDYMEYDRVIVADCAHYDEPMFRFLLQDMWAMPVDDFLRHLKDLNVEANDSEDDL